MLPGVELARRRRVHFHGDVASSAGAGDHAHAHAHHHYAHAHHAGPAAVEGPALAARIRLEGKLRGAALPPTPTSPSRWSRLMRDGRSNSTSRRAQSRGDQQQQQHQEQQQVLGPTGAEPWRRPPPPPPPGSAALLQAAATVPAARRRAELTRTLSMVDVCAVCLDEVRERHQRVTRLPCSHKYHSDCVLPWLAIHPDCPCCRALVPSVDTLA